MRKKWKMRRNEEDKNEMEEKQRSRQKQNEEAEKQIGRREEVERGVAEEKKERHEATEKK